MHINYKHSYMCIHSIENYQHLWTLLVPGTNHHPKGNHYFNFCCQKLVLMFEKFWIWTSWNHTVWTVLCLLSLIQHSVQFSRSVVSDPLWPHELQHARPPCKNFFGGGSWNFWLNCDAFWKEFLTARKFEHHSCVSWQTQRKRS